jgi:hypothetical protein
MYIYLETVKHCFVNYLFLVIQLQCSKKYLNNSLLKYETQVAVY